jgi:hypothetical protein
MGVLSNALINAILLASALAHPGHDVREEALERRDFMSRRPNSVRSCSSSLEARGIVTSAVHRRQEMARQARSKRENKAGTILRRDFAAYNFTHQSGLDVTLGSDEELLFDDDSSCVLQPEVTQGPYYVDGELIRGDITGDQEGVPLYLDIQLVDVSTCEPVPAMFVDLWHCTLHLFTNPDAMIELTKARR